MCLRFIFYPMVTHSPLSIAGENEAWMSCLPCLHFLRCRSGTWRFFHILSERGEHNINRERKSAQKAPNFAVGSHGVHFVWRSDSEGVVREGPLVQPSLNHTMIQVEGLTCTEVAEPCDPSVQDPRSASGVSITESTPLGTIVQGVV